MRGFFGFFYLDWVFSGLSLVVYFRVLGFFMYVEREKEGSVFIGWSWYVWDLIIWVLNIDKVSLIKIE